MADSGQRISEYILDEKIGAGTFGEVWRAHHHVWADQLVAIKLPTDVQYVRNLQREGAAIHGLVHPNIVRAIGFDPFATQPYLTMEYVPGTSLRPRIGPGKCDAQQAVRILGQVLNGLDYAHQRGMVHRDIKPENILIDTALAGEDFATAGAVKITDFGLGKAAATTAVGSIVYSQSLNDPAAVSIAGTLDYMPPEQRQGQPVDGRADLYACGVVLYELLTGERPAGTLCPSDVCPEVPKYLDEVFRRSYTRLDRRYKSAAEFAAALQINSPLPRQGELSAPASVSTTGRHCPQCRRNLDEGDQFCMYCGVQVVADVRRCIKCGAWPDHQDQFCQQCGSPLAAKVSV